jgi:hypothetical protein
MKELNINNFFIKSDSKIIIDKIISIIESKKICIFENKISRVGYTKTKLEEEHPEFFEEKLSMETLEYVRNFLAILYSNFDTSNLEFFFEFSKVKKDIVKISIKADIYNGGSYILTNIFSPAENEKELIENITNLIKSEFFCSNFAISLIEILDLDVSLFKNLYKRIKDELLKSISISQDNLKFTKKQLSNLNKKFY